MRYSHEVKERFYTGEGKKRKKQKENQEEKSGK